MKHDFKLSLPELCNFDMEYYISDDETPVEPRILPPHIHDNLEAYVLLEGNPSFMVENKIYKLKPLDIVVSKPNEIHNCIIECKTVHKHMCFWFNPSSEFLFSGLTQRKFGENNLITPSDTDKARLKELLHSLTKASLEEKHLLEYSLATEFIYILNKSSGEDNISAMLPNTLKKILNDINKNFAEIPSINYLTDKYFISHSQLCRLFKQYLHTTPKLYLETKRLANAKIMLKNGKTVIEACIESGFPDYSNFIRLFKTSFGMTPNQYKKS